MKFAVFCTPHLGGTWTVAKCLHEGLSKLGHSVVRVNYGSKGVDAAHDPLYAEDARWGVVVTSSDNREIQSRSIYDYILNEKFDGVFIDVLADLVPLNLCRYFPPDIRRIMIVHSITAGTYRAVAAMADYFDGIVAISPRIKSDLIRKHGIAENKIFLIPNALPNMNAPSRNNSSSRDRLHLISLGRLENQSKGVFLIPKIMKEAEGQADINIFGAGPDEDELKKRCRDFSDIHFRGAVNPAEVLSTFADHDVFLMPSNYEGFGYTLVEAMSAGCVPVATRLPGVTDFIVTHGKDGFLFERGNIRQAAEFIRQLKNDPSLLADMSTAAKQTAMARFNISTQARAYQDMISEIVRLQPVQRTCDIRQWQMSSALECGMIRKMLPEWSRRILRKIRWLLLKTN